MPWFASRQTGTSMATEMHLYLRLLSRVLFDGMATRLRGEATNGAFGVLPNHVDFLTAPC